MDFHRVRKFDLAWSGHHVLPELRPSDYAVPSIAADLIDALPGVRRSFALADGTTYHYFHSIADVLRFLQESLPPGTTLQNAEAHIARALHTWELGLSSRHSPTSNVPKTRAAHIRRVLRYMTAHGDLLSRDVVQWAAGKHLHESGYSRPLDEFSNAERLLIRDRSRERIRALEKRMAKGLELLRNAEDPRLHGWNSLPNVLLGINSLVAKDAVDLLMPMSEAITSGALDALPEAAHLRTRRDGGATHRALGIATSYVYATAEDLTAFTSLLQLDTGAAPEEIRELRVSDIDFEGNEVRLRVRKRRGRRDRVLHLDRTESGRSWRGGDLILRVIDATAAARRHVSADPTQADRLFLSARRDRTGRIYFAELPVHLGSLGRLLEGVEAEVSKPHDARRLRKTVKSVRAAVLRSVSGAAGEDHSIAVFQRHYAQTTTVHMLAGEAITAAQTQVFQRLRTGPVFVADTAEHLQNVDDELVAVAASEVLAETDVDKQVSAAHCTQPYASPYDPIGRLCSHRPAMCFACPNAVVFVDHLPRLIAYREVLRGYERDLPPTQFSATYGQQLVNLEHIIREFSPDRIADAEAAGRELHIPLRNRGEYT